MRNTYRGIWLILLLTAAAPLVPVVRGAHDWEKQELTFTAARAYTNAYTEAVV